MENLRGRGVKETGKNMAPVSFFQRDRTGGDRKGGVYWISRRPEGCNLRVARMEGEMTEAGSVWLRKGKGGQGTLA